MALDFPSNPQQGDQYTGSNGVIYLYDGIKWVGYAPAPNPVTGSSNSIINNGEVVQIAPNGDLSLPSYVLPNTTGTYGQVLGWPLTGNVLRWKTESGSGQGSIYVGSVPPDNPTENQLWYNNEDSKIYVYYINTWVDTSTPVNINSSIDWTSIPSSIVPSSDLAYDLGSLSRQWRSLYVGTATIFIGGVPLTLNTSSNTLVIGTSTNNTSTTALATEQFVIQYISTSTGGGGGTFNGVTSGLKLTGEIPMPIPLLDESNVWIRPNNNEAVTAQIDTGLTLKRKNSGGAIYNSAGNVETQWNSNVSPLGTEWNTDGWHDLSDVQARTYTTFYKACDQNVGQNVVGREFVMHDTINNKYYKVEFTFWQPAGGGGSSNPLDSKSGITMVYTPIILTNVTYFVHAANSSTSDVVDTGLTITRGSNGGGIYNSVSDLSGFDPDYSPGGTLWNADYGWKDFSDITALTYKPLYAALHGYLGEKIVGAELIMWDTINNKYYTVKFTEWGWGNGGSFAYVRRQIVPSTGRYTGITFADGTHQRTALTLGNLKVKNNIISNERYPDQGIYVQVPGMRGWGWNSSSWQGDANWITNGNDGRIEFTSPVTPLIDFLNRLYKWSSVKVSINGGDLQSVVGWGWNSITTELPPATNPTIVTNLDFHLTFNNEFVMDDNDGNYGIYLDDTSNSFSINAQHLYFNSNGYIEIRNNGNGSTQIVTNGNNSSKYWEFDVNGVLHLPPNVGDIKRNGFSVLGGSTGDITWNGVQMIGTGTYNSGFAGNLGSIDIVPNADLVGSGQYVHIRPTTNLDETHIHVMAGNVDTADIFLGDDNRFVKIDHTGPVKVGVPVARWDHYWYPDYTAYNENYVHINLANPNNAWAKFIAVGDVATFPDSSTATVLNTWLNVNDNHLYVYFTNNNTTHSFESGQTVTFSIRERAEFNFGSGEGTDWVAYFGSLTTDNKPFKIGTGSSKQYGFNTAYFESGNGGVNGVFNGTRNAQYFSLIVTAHTNGTGYYTVDSYNPGNSFYSGFYFTIPGTDLGGMSPENDLVFTVTGTDGGSGAITQYSISDTAVRPNWTFNTDGSLQPSSRGQYRVPVSYTPSQYTTVESTATSAVVFDYSANNHTAKVLIQVEGFSNTLSNWDTQSCEMIIVTSFRTNTPVASVYGLVHTSTLPIATFDAQYNSSTGRIEIVCTKTTATVLTAINALSVVVVGTTISTSD